MTWQAIRHSPVAGPSFPASPEIAVVTGARKRWTDAPASGDTTEVGALGQGRIRSGRESGSEPNWFEIRASMNES
jgi:hypothetical protein